MIQYASIFKESATIEVRTSFIIANNFNIDGQINEDPHVLQALEPHMIDRHGRSHVCFIIALVNLVDYMIGLRRPENRISDQQLPFGTTFYVV